MSEDIAPELLARSRRKFSDVMGADLVKDGEEGETKAYPIVFMGRDGKPEPAWESQAAAADLRRWKVRAIKAVRAGKGADVRFESDAIPVAEQARIREALAGAQSAGDVAEAFKTEDEAAIDWQISEQARVQEALGMAQSAMVKAFETKAKADPTDALIDAEFDAALAWAKKAMEG